MDKMVAFGFEAGYQAGRAEALSDEALKLIRNPHTTYFESTGHTRESASTGHTREWA